MTVGNECLKLRNDVDATIDVGVDDVVVGPDG